jgi:serine/threonine-protein kinase
MFVCPECGQVMGQAGHCPQDGTPLAPRGDDHLLGTTLGPYQVARLLGVGGMGRVYKGVHPQIGSRVAIKVLSHECAQRPELVERFFSEARAVNLIRHESIVNVLDLAKLPDGRPYIIMEYLDGAPLAAIVEKAGPLPLGSLARLIAEVLDALGAAHAKGIVHRDLKPDNIFITPAGRPKVLDFGIAKLQQNLTPGAATQTGSLLGTPHYMAPEQAMGRAIDLRTDLYAIGVILFECATGRRPFHADSLFDLLRKHVDEPPPPPRALRPDMPSLYEQVILRALEKHPDHRWQNTLALATALHQATQGLGAEAWMPINPGTATAIAAQRTPGSWPSGPTHDWPSRPGATPVPPTHPQAVIPTQHAPPPVQNPSTATAGQVMAARPSGGGKGVWIALAALLLVAGGGAAAYFATRGGGGQTASASAGDEPTELPEAPVEDDPADPPDPDDVDPPDEPAEPVEAAEDDLEKKMQDLEKELEKKMQDLGEQMGQIDLGSADDLSGPIPLARPAGFDPAAFDISGYYPTAEAEAKRVWADAKLVRIDASGVRPTGLAELTLSDDFYVRYWFRSEKASKRPADLPIGVEHEAICNLQIWIDTSGAKLLPMSWDCDTLLAPPPKCTFKQAWDKAIQIGAPSGNAVASISYMANIVSKKVRWFVDVGDEFSEQIPDGC